MRFRIQKKAQVMVEFIFSMIILLLMMFAVMMVFRWAGMDLVYRRMAHDNVLTANIVEDYGDSPEEGPFLQVDPYFYDPIEMNAIYDPDE